MNPRLIHERSVVFKRIEAVFHVSEDELLDNTRGSADIAWARQVAYYALRQGHWSLGEIGVALNRDHTSVHHGIGRVERRVRVSQADARDVSGVSRPISASFDAERTALGEIEVAAIKIHEAMRDAIAVLRGLEAEAHTLRLTIEGDVQTRGAA